MDKAVLLNIENNIAWITLNRPKGMNCMSVELCEGLCEAVNTCENDPEVRVVVLTGSGRAFCAGGDLKALLAFSDAAAAEAYVRDAGVAAKNIFHSKKPYIAMVNGAAAGAGFNLALVCDFVFAADNAKFTQAFSSVGLVSDCGGNYLLPYAVGPMKAKELMMLPATITAEEAKEIGIVRTVCPADELKNEVEAFAGRLVSRPPLSVAGTKELVNAYSRLSFDDMMAREERVQGVLAVGEDAKEGISAFFEKREANFKGNS